MTSLSRIWRIVSMSLALAMAGGCAHGAARMLRLTVVNASAWPAVVNLSVGQSVEVQQRDDGRRVTGVVVAADSSQLTLTVAGVARRFEAWQVREVVALGPRAVARSVRRGSLVGAIAGATLNAITVKSGRAPWVLMGAAGGGVIGALGGLVDGASNRERRVIYRATVLTAPPPPPVLLAHINQEIGTTPMDCGAGVDSPHRGGLRRMTSCAIRASRDRRPFFFAVWDVSDDSARLWGLLGKQDGRIQQFLYDSYGDRFILTPCSSPVAGATVFDFRCGPSRALPESSAFTRFWRQ